MNDTISSCQCTECKKELWVNLGNTSDMTQEDPDGAHCPHCEKDFLFEGVQEIFEIMGESFASANIIKGYKTPNEAANHDLPHLQETK